MSPRRLGRLAARAAAAAAASATLPSLPFLSSRAASSAAALPSRRAEPLPRLHSPSPTALAALLASSQPALLSGCLAAWRLSAWEPSALLADPALSALVLPFELSKGGADYRDAFHPRPGRAFARDVDGTLGDFVRKFLLTPEEAEAEAEERASRVVGEGGISHSSSAGSSPQQQQQPPRPVQAYLAQFDLLALAPALAAACPTPSLVPAAAAAAGAVQLRTWLGPAGTETPLHRDPYHNLLCQARAAKQLSELQLPRRCVPAVLSCGVMSSMSGGG